jgi:hypothetical protein
MKMFNYINCGLVCLLSASAMYGSNCNRDWREVAAEGVRLMYFRKPLNPEMSRYRDFLIEVGLCDKDGNYNKDVTPAEVNNAFAKFFKRIPGGHLSSDLLAIAVLPGNPDINAKDSDGYTAQDYVDMLPSAEERDCWSEYLMGFSK